MTNWRRFLLLVVGCITVGFSVMWGVSIYMDKMARERVYADLAIMPSHRVGLVLGCSPTVKDGRANLFFLGRIEAAATLWKSGKVQYLLVSGDNHVAGYDEPTRMKEALVLRGVPESAVVLDYAGFSTFDSVVRARDVFGVNELCVITQADHAKRAIYIADRLGVKADAFPAASVGFRFGFRTWAREGLARVRTVLDLSVLKRKPHFLGPKILIAQGA